MVDSEDADEKLHVLWCLIWVYTVCSSCLSVPTLGVITVKYNRDSASYLLGRALQQ